MGREKRQEKVYDAQEFSLRLKINHPLFEFELSTRDPETLETIKEILELLPAPIDEMLPPEEIAFQDIALKLSPSFTENKKGAAVLRDLLRHRQPYRLAVVDIPTTAAIDIEAGTRSIRTRRTDVQRCVRSLTDGFPPSSVRNGIIHVCGELDEEDKLFIVDCIHKPMPTAHLRAFQSPRPKDQTGVVVECVFFGDFPKAQDE